MVANYQRISIRFGAQILIGTNAINKSENYLKLTSISLPSTLVGATDSIPVPSDGIDTSNFKVVTQWKQTQEINKLKVSPNGSLAVGFSADGVIRSYNLDNFDSVDYKYHKQGGIALDWVDNNGFLSGSNDVQIALWQVDKSSTPLQLFKGHHGAINDISSIKENTCLDLLVMILLPSFTIQELMPRISIL